MMIALTNRSTTSQIKKSQSDLNEKIIIKYAKQKKKK